MSYYFVDAVRFAANEQRIVAVRWMYFDSPHPKDYNPTIADVDKAIAALDHHDIVFLLIESAPGEFLHGPKFERKIYSGGAESIYIPEIEMTDLPTF